LTVYSVRLLLQMRAEGKRYLLWSVYLKGAWSVNKEITLPRVYARVHKRNVEHWNDQILDS